MHSVKPGVIVFVRDPEKKRRVQENGARDIV
jgi:hypothetical protein